MERPLNALMNALKEHMKLSGGAQPHLAFSMYSSLQEQHLLNVPVVKPLLIAVLSGEKQLGKDFEYTCLAGDFIFLSDSPVVHMRNIPNGLEYLALLIEFEYDDFADLPAAVRGDKGVCTGEITSALELSLRQFMDWSSVAPKHLWSLRRKELLQLLRSMGYEVAVPFGAHDKVGQRLYALMRGAKASMSLESMCATLAVSESTLRRKLKTEGTSLQEIKDQAKLGLGLHLLQTTNHAIAFISEECGYDSQSRFSARFKQRFGLTPSALRKTLLKA